MSHRGRTQDIVTQIRKGLWCKNKPSTNPTCEHAYCSAWNRLTAAVFQESLTWMSNRTGSQSLFGKQLAHWRPHPHLNSTLTLWHHQVYLAWVMRTVSISFLALLMSYVCRDMVTRVNHGPLKFLGSVFSGEVHLTNAELSFGKDKQTKQTQKGTRVIPQLMIQTDIPIVCLSRDSKSWQRLITLCPLGLPGTFPLIRIYLLIIWVNHSLLLT